MDRTRNGRGYDANAVDPNIDASGKNLFWKFVATLNKWLNPAHAWTDYQGKNDSMVDSWLKKESGAGLTAADVAANQFNADEAQKQRDWEEHMSSTAYQRQVADMRAAGVNPAMAMHGASGASTPSGSAATSVSPSGGSFSFQDILSLYMLPLQRKLVNAQAKQASDQGEAALITARANERNAGVNERNAGTNERNAGVNEENARTNKYQAETARIRADIERFVAETNARMTDKQIEKMSHEIAYIDETKDYISKNYEVAVKNANAHQKQAFAAMRSAEAAYQNALTNEYLSNYQADVLFSQCLVNELVAQEKEIDISFLPEKTQAQIEELRSRGYMFNQQGRLVDKQGKLVEAQTAETYTRMATEISHGVCEIVNTVTGLIPGKRPAPIGYK